MDVPLRLRLAYTSRFSDPYADTRHILPYAPLGREGTSSATRHGSSWLGSLLQYMEVSHQQLYAEPAARKHDTNLVASVVSSDAEMQVDEEKEGTTSFDFPGAPHSSSFSPAHTPRSPGNAPSFTTQEASFPRELKTPVGSLRHLSNERSSSSKANRRRSSTAVSKATLKTSAAAENAEGPRQGAPLPEKADIIIQADVVADAAAEADSRQRTEQQAGTYEAHLADITTSLEHRLHQCVLKTLALDDANQQLICAFQLPPTNSEWRSSLSRLASPSVELKSTVENGTEKDEARQKTLVNSKHVTEITTVAAKSSNENLSDETKKELAMHLYALRHQVVTMRQQLDAHEAMHARQVNVFRASSKNASSMSSAVRPPIRVEIIKAYEENPVPYRKGPWREANFAAATHRENDKKVETHGGGEDDYATDDFIDEDDISSSASLSNISKELSTDDSSVKPAARSGNALAPNSGKRVVAASDKGKAEVSIIDSDSSLSSTEGLFQRRQAAALQARAQRAAATAAAAAAASTHQRKRSSSSTSPSSYSSTESTYSTLTESTTTTITTATTDSLSS